MVQRQVLSVIFLALISANVIQAGVLGSSLPLGLLHRENAILPYFRSAFGDFGSKYEYLKNLPLIQKLTDLSDPFRSSLRNYFTSRGIGRSVTSPANGIADSVANGILSSEDIPSVDHLIKSDFFRRHLLGNYGIGSPTGAASSPFRVASSTSSTTV